MFWGVWYYFFFLDWSLVELFLISIYVVMLLIYLIVKYVFLVVFSKYYILGWLERIDFVMIYVKNIVNVINMDREWWIIKFDCNCKVCVF